MPGAETLGRQLLVENRNPGPDTPQLG